MAKEITIIELLNKIANGKKVPEYIKYFNKLSKKTDKMMVCKENIIYKLDQMEIELNDLVEILDEENDEFEDIEEIVKLGCNIETQIGDEIHLIDIEKPLVTEVMINDINKLIRNQKRIIERLNKDE